MTELPKKYSMQERREELKQLIIQLGYDNLNVSTLSERYQVTRKTIYCDLKSIMANVPQDELERERSKAYYSFISYDRRLGKVIEEHKNDPDIVLKAIDTHSKVWERKAKVFESFKLKERLEDNVRVVFDYGERDTNTTPPA